MLPGMAPRLGGFGRVRARRGSAGPPRAFASAGPGRPGPLTPRVEGDTKVVGTGCPSVRRGIGWEPTEP